MIKKTFKELVQADVAKVFMNGLEFADTHIINGVEMLAIIDENENIEREKRMKSNMDGIYARQILIYVIAETYGPLPSTTKMLVLDGKRYIVIDAIDENGIYSITLEANRS